MKTSTSEHTYEIIVSSTPENVWKALTDGEITQKYFFNTRTESNWAVGSPVIAYNQDGGVSSEGEVLEIKPLSHLKITFKPLWLASNGTKPSTVSWDIQPLDTLTLVKLTHADIDNAVFEAGQMHIGWVYILSSLKSLLETNKALPVPKVFS